MQKNVPEIQKTPAKDSANSTSLNPTAKTLLYITGFAIVMQCDLWITVCAFVLVSGYLLKAGFITPERLSTWQAAAMKTMDSLKSKTMTKQPSSGHRQSVASEATPTMQPCIVVFVQELREQEITEPQEQDESHQEQPDDIPQDDMSDFEPEDSN